jgi:hypothetical protein
LTVVRRCRRPARSTISTAQATRRPAQPTLACSASCFLADAPDVHGVAHRVTRPQWRHILETEGAAGTQADTGYGVYAVEVEAYDGRVLPALTLRTLPKSIAQLKVRRQPETYIQTCS